MKREIIGNRRTFIKGAALLGGLAVWLGMGRPDVFKTQAQPPAQEPPTGQGYRLTEHVKKYYESARS